MIDNRKSIYRYKSALFCCLNHVHTTTTTTPSTIKRFFSFFFVDDESVSIIYAVCFSLTEKMKRE